uniref:AIG1-type G domain-containing protein n=1 Tax=Pygocentrus nattereri TaxID=42514 RepID=A0AAR2JG40_PYGNA
MHLSASTPDPPYERKKAEDVRVVLLGKTGVGKSATANIIMGKKVYRELLRAQSVTTQCQKESSDDTYKVKRRITVIDTPGLFDTKISNEEISKEIIKCITMAAPGPHVFLLVIALGRFTKEEQDAVKTIQELFGEESRKYTIVLFTRGDDLQEMKMSIEEFIKDSDPSLQNIIHQCGNRHHVFNNRNIEDRSQVTDLLEKIDAMVFVNGGSCYTNEITEIQSSILDRLYLFFCCF